MSLHEQNLDNSDLFSEVQFWPILFSCMKAITLSDPLFTANQELNALCSTNPHVSGQVEAYDIDATQSSCDDDFPVVAGALVSSFPDYDFSWVAPRHFRTIQTPEAAREGIAWALSSALGIGGQRVGSLWQILEIELCRIYAYEPDCADPFSQSGVLSNLCYFFVNRKQMKVVMFHLRAGARNFESEAEDSWNDGLDEDFEERYGYGVC
jgi:hypothetical protein